MATIDTLGNGELTTAWHLMNPFRAEGEEDVIWNRGRVLLQSHEEFAYDVIIGVAASGFYGPKDIGFFAFDDVELVRRSVLDSLFVTEDPPHTSRTDLSTSICTSCSQHDCETLPAAALPEPETICDFETDLCGWTAEASPGGLNFYRTSGAEVVRGKGMVFDRGFNFKKT